MPRAILDTNVFVAAGFNRASACARLLRAVEAGRLELVWSEATRRETRAVLERIPRLRWSDAEPLFRPEAERPAPGDLSGVGFVEDPEDRKFAALSLASGAPLVTADDHLLAHRDRLDVHKPSEFLRACGDLDAP
ncbi:MAG: PIN domain-containing protein [Pseudomonadota bacterium]